MFDIEKFVKNQSGEDRQGLENLVRSFASNIQEKNILSQEVTTRSQLDKRRTVNFG